MKFGYQLYSALALCKDKAGLVDTLEKIAALGYDGVEFCGYADIPAAEMKALLTRLDLEGFNSHVHMERWLADPEGEIRYAAEAGIPCVTIPWIPPEMRNEEGYAQIKAMVPRLLEWCKQYGVQLMYHNHDFEFATDTNGRYVLDDILEADPELSLELDTFWAYFVGVDPLIYMESHKDKLKMIHIKDYEKLSGVPQAGGGEAPTFCAIGAGLMDNQSILDWAKANGVTWVCVDQDNSRIPELEAAKISIESLRQGGSMAGTYSEYPRNRAQNCTIHIFDLETGHITDVVSFDTVVEAPNWTRDGKYLIFNSQGKLWRLDLETREVSLIPTGIADTCNNDHVLNPDGSGIACSSGRNGDSTSRIYTIDFATGEVRCIVSENLSYLHGWSPDGKTLAFCAGREHNGEMAWDIYTVPVQGGPETRLTDAPGLNDGPEYAPDGKKIWFNSLRSGLMQVYVMNADGSEQTQMTFDDDRNAWFPHISPDNSKVVYVAYNKGDLEPGQHLPDLNVEIRMISAEGGPPKTLVNLFGGQGTMNVNSWSPDSRKFAYVSYWNS